MSTPSRSDNRRGTRRWLALCGVLAALAPALASARAANDDFDADPIRYSASQPHDPVARLQERIDRGEVQLQYDDARGYLPAVLKALGVPVSSQMLVFSKTSFQRERISPLSPRALYFNDGAYVGWVQGGPVLELSAVDPQLGAVFYLLSQDPTGRPKFVRQGYECLSCHASSMTKGVPGHVMRSVYPARDGQPVLAAGTFLTRDESPMRERWGGWYVTGSHGSQRHLGNITVSNADDMQGLDLAPSGNARDLRRWVDSSPYLTGHSDIVALMVLAHQAEVQNLITRANYETRRALSYEQALNHDLARPADYRSESTTSRIRSVAEPLARALLFVKEAPLTAPVEGTSGYTAEFPKAGPRDPRGRSLRDFDLKRRLFRYPCSYLIYSPEFDALPAPAKQMVYQRLREVLSGKDTSPDFAHLSTTDREAILEILRATKPDLAAFVKAAA